MLPQTHPVHTADGSPKILTIIVNWNKRDMLEPLLASLPKQMTRFYFDVLVVDNASTDGSQQMVREKFPWVHLLTHETNLGGTGGFNAGMRWGMENEKDYDFLWLLDNDVALKPDALNGLVDAIETLPHTGCCGSTILIMDDPEQVQEAGCNILWSNGSLMSQGIGNVRDLPPGAVWQVDYVAACSLLARTQAIRDIGIWDPGYFLYWDDIDWGLRFNRAGWRVVATTASQVWHESFNNRRSGQGMSAFYLCVRNRQYCLHKLHPNRLIMPLTLFRVITGDLVFAANAINAGYPDKAKAVMAGVNDFLNNRLGPPPRELFRPVTDDIPRQTEPSTDFLRNARRIMMLTGENPEYSARMYNMLRNTYPDAQIRVMVYADSVEPFIKAGVENTEHRDLTTFGKRLRLHLQAATSFDAVAVTHFATHLLAERLAPRLIIVHDDLSFFEIRRTTVSVLRRLFTRPYLWFRAARIVCGIIATQTIPKVNHHSFRPFSQPSITMEPGYEWTKWKQKRLHSLPYKILRDAVGLILMPFVILWILIPFLFLPLFRLHDRNRSTGRLRNLTYLPKKRKPSGD